MTPLPNWIIPIKLPMPATLGSVNVYLIRGPNGNALIDTGMNDRSSIKSLQVHLKDLALTFENIQTVLFTHHHADHAGLGDTFSRAGAKTMMSQRDAKSLMDFFANPQQDKDRATFFGLHEVPETFAKKVAPMFPFFRGLAQSFEPQILLEHKQEISLGGIPFSVLITPGHTMGHICLVHRDQIILTGDCVTSGNATHISMRHDVMGTDPLQHFIDSLSTLGNLNVKLALPGHGKPITDLRCRTESIIKHHRDRMNHVAQSLKTEPQSAYDITVDSMGERPKPFATWLAMSQTLAYLEHLETQERCQRIETSKGLLFNKQK